MADSKFSFDKLKERFTYFEIGIVVAMIGYFIYLSSSTSLVLNYNNATNESRVINGVENKPGTILYGPNDYVPKSNVTNTQTFFGIAMFLIVVFVLTSKLVKAATRARIDEALKQIADELIKAKQLKDARITVIRDGIKIITDFTDIDLTYNFLTRYKAKGETREAFRYTICVVEHDKTNNTEQYYRAYYHPWTRYWDGLVKTDKGLFEIDQFPKCGDEYDEKIIIGEDVKKYSMIKKELTAR